MKKEIFYFSLILSLILILSLSLVSAFSFPDFWNKITGKEISNPQTFGMISLVSPSNLTVFTHNKIDSLRREYVQIYFSWSFPNEKDIDYYVFVVDSGYGHGEVNVSSTSRFGKYIGIGEFKWKIKACNSLGCSDWSEQRTLIVNPFSSSFCAGPDNENISFGQCSSTKPLYCDNGNLINQCSSCGCSSGQQCQSDGSCKVGVNQGNNILLLHLDEKILNSISGGKDVQDISGNNHHGIEFGGVSFGETGKISTALKFDGVDDLISLEDDILDGKNKLTIEAWIKPEEKNINYHAIMSDAKAFYFMFGSTGYYKGKLMWRTWDSNGQLTKVILSDNPVIKWGEWQHVAITFDSNIVKLYHNGIIVGNSYAHTGKTLYNGVDKTAIGGRGTYTQWYFKGLIDEVGVYDYSLSESEINSHYNLKSECGNNIKEGSEECDGSDNSACSSGKCKSDCKCEIVPKCSDGTYYSQCSLTKPKYCSDGKLINQCSSCGCDAGKECKSDGSCKEKVNQENKKLMSKYFDKEVFLISDKNWKDVLPLVPLTTWTKQKDDNSNCQKGYGTPDNVCVYPTLIYHDEAKIEFDADSVIYFMQQYNAKKVTIIGTTRIGLDNLLIASPKLGVGLKSNQINKTSVADYLSYWESFKDIVYVEDNYELALLASTYASLINAPLIILGTDLDKDNVFTERNVICVGDVNKNCNEKYNLEQLQKKYVEETKTDKIILVNPNDLSIHESTIFGPDKSTAISELYSKASLASPFLASAKQEIIFSIKSIDVFEVDSLLTSKLKDFYTTSQIKENTLTIISNPNAIPMYAPGDLCAFVDRIEADGRIYGSLNNYEYIDMSVGRIMGISLSDVSSNIARSLFFDKLNRNKNALLVVREDHQDEVLRIAIRLGRVTKDYAQDEVVLETYAREFYWTDTIKNKFENEYFYSGHKEVLEKSKEIHEGYDDAFLILFADHGSSGGFSGMMSSYYMKSNKIYLSPSLVIDLACSTCYYRGDGNEFCAQGIRRGAIAQQGAVDVSYWHQEFDDVLDGIIIKGKTIGEAYKDARNEDYKINHYNFCYGIRGDPFYALLGDPNWKPKWW